jgi:NTP pyrophosphatase (non-canonical NTP hydrolase)
MTTLHLQDDQGNIVERYPSISFESIVRECLHDSQAWFPDRSRDIPYLLLCLMGEAGEACNEVKKVLRGTHTYMETRSGLEEEITDVFIYLMNIIGVLGFDIIAAYRKKRAFNDERFRKVDDRNV